MGERIESACPTPDARTDQFLDVPEHPLARRLRKFSSKTYKCANTLIAINSCNTTVYAFTNYDIDNHSQKRHLIAADTSKASLDDRLRLQ